MSLSTALFAKIPDLTTAELRVARLVSRGLRTKEVAERLKISRHTVGTGLMGALRDLVE